MIIINAHVIAAIVTVTIIEMAYLYKDIRTYSPLLAINPQGDSIDNHKMYDFISHLLSIQLFISLSGIYDYDEDSIEHLITRLIQFAHANEKIRFFINFQSYFLRWKKNLVNQLREIWTMRESCLTEF